jgi:predicted amidohydrolase YtcJ
MKLMILLAVLPVILLSTCATGVRRIVASPAGQTAIVHARIYGADAADGVLVSGGRIQAVGASADIQSRCADPCRVIDAQGKFLAPGFHDSHIHLIDAAKAEFDLQIHGSAVADVQASLKDYAKAHPEKTWIFGGSWSVLSLTPRKEDLDAIESSRPVALKDASGHQLWVNSKALALANITKDTPDPVGGKIVRDANGDPTGYLQESATYPVHALIPAPTLDEYKQYILKGQQETLALGLTSLQGAAVPLTLVEAQAYADLDQQGLLKQRSFLWGNLVAKPADFQAMVSFAKSLPAEGKVHVVAFKGFVDGVLTAETAAMLDPYTDHPENSGLPKLSQAQLNQFVLRANRAGFPAALHSMGDRAIQMTLNAFEFSQKTLGRSFGNRVEHATVIAPEDFARFRTLGAIASVQPNFMYYPTAQSFPYFKTLGPDRITRLYPWKTLADAGAFLIFGSDHPDGGSSRADPLTGMFCATQRVFKDGTPFTPEQRLDALAAMQAYTANPAAAIGLGDRLGKIEAGYDADLVLLEKDPRAPGIHSVQDDPLAWAMVAGEIVTR